MKIVLYSFRTNPCLKELNNIFGDVFIFGKLKEDFKSLKKKIMIERPDLILGIANIDEASRIEPMTVNKFNKGRILLKGSEGLRLFIPPNNSFPIAEKSTSSFCNWTMYQVANFILEKELGTRFSFVHLNKKDISRLNNFL